MSQNAVFSGSYADFKLVKTRSVASISIELPIERAEAFVALFGLPQPGKEQAVAIALLDMTKASPEPETVAAVLPAPSPEAQKAITIAGIWPGDLAFRRWCMGYAPNDMQAPDCGEDTATEWLRGELGVKSRKEIAHDPAVLAKFNRIKADYDTACGRRF